MKQQNKWTKRYHVNPIRKRFTSRAEDGNIRYDYFYPMNDAETILLIDSWENQKAIDIHHASPMMEQITRLREKYDLSMKVERYVSDESGMPSADKKYIRS
jgi:quinol monooxygenase YgiN